MGEAGKFILLHPMDEVGRSAAVLERPQR